MTPREATERGTPRTDALVRAWEVNTPDNPAPPFDQHETDELVFIEHARQLERELSAAQDHLKDAVDHGKMGWYYRDIAEKERDELAGKLAEAQRDASRYRWWRENYDAVEENGGLAESAFDSQIPMFGIDPSVTKEPTTAELMDAIADAAIAMRQEGG